jgi:hypothetical protein
LWKSKNRGSSTDPSIGKNAKGALLVVLFAMKHANQNAKQRKSCQFLTALTG